MTDDPDVVEAELAPFVRQRFSPMRYDAQCEVSAREVRLLLEAARRAPSAGNSQPWSFAVGRRGDDVHRRLVRHLARSSAAWAPDAGLLMANLAQVRVEGSDLEYSEFAHYDLAQAVTHLSVQAHALGLQVHQFRAFDRDGLRADLALPQHLEVVTMAAVGVPDPDSGEVIGAGTSRERRAVEQLIWSGA